MKTLADVKRRLKVGTVLHLEHADPQFSGLRTVLTVQSNAFASLPEGWSDEQKAKHPGGSWMYWPKAAEVAVEGDGFTVHPGTERPLRYRFVTDPS